jgi:aspartyl aminopeptidase
MTDAATGLLRFIDASPTPVHAVATASGMLRDAGFRELSPTDDWTLADAVEAAFVVRDGTLVAWGGAVTPAPDPGGALRLIGAHTDSPNLRIRPRPDRGLAGFRQLAVEVYGSPLLNSWLDRDLGLAGRVAVRTGDGAESRPFRTDTAVLRIPQLAIHLDREISQQGLLLNRQQHLSPVWGLGDPAEGDFRDWVGGLVGAAADDVVGWDAMCFDVQPGEAIGVDGDLLAVARLDNLCSCFGAVTALLAAGPDARAVPVVALFDHEEVGSTSATGADGDWLAQVLERRVLALGGGRADLLGSLARSFLLSADMAHATHPNYPDRHESNHWIRAGGGPVIKHNVSLRYATDSRGSAAFRAAAAAAGVDVQDYSHRGDMACGSTIGPFAAAGLALDTVDVGMAQLSMHSARELMATRDVDAMVAAFTAWFAVA